MENVGNVYVKLVNSLDIGSKNGSFTLDESFVIYQSCETVKQFVEKYLLTDSVVESDYNLENLNTKLNSLLLGLEKACKNGSFTLSQAAETRVLYNQLFQSIKDKLEKDSKKKDVNTEDDMTVNN